YSSSTESGPVNVTVVSTPTVTQPPQNADRLIGQSVTFTVSASGTGLFDYQWYFNGNPVSNSDSNVLTISNIGAVNAGQYSVLVVNDYGLVFSTAATL